MKDSYTLKSLAVLLENNKISSKELTSEYLKNIENGKELNCYNTISQEKALIDAEKSDERRKSQNLRSKYDGIPIGIKDLFCTKGVTTTASSKILSNFVPNYESTVTQNCDDAGLISLGKLNCDEFAMGSTNKTSFFGSVKNPWKSVNSDNELVPGGSSGGSAAAVSGDLCVASLGTDTGGSIRQPASFTGTVGLKPSYGRVSRWGIVAFASSLDQAGPITKTVEDAAILLDIISGHDEKDSTSSVNPKENYYENLNSDIKGMKIGIPKEFRSDKLPASTQKSWDECANLLKTNGAEIVDISLPHTMSALPAYYIIAPAEASSNLARYDGVRYGLRVKGNDLIDMYEKTRSEGFGDEVKRRILIGTYVLSSGYYDAYYIKAQKIRSLIKSDYVEAFKKVDAILTPSTPSTAFEIANEPSDPVQNYLNDIFTVPVNLAGLPGISIPYANDENNLPIGLQLITNSFEEQKLLNVARNIEETINYSETPEKWWLK
ncbi:MAG: glutamyl-tRNA(Gln) amidotransferase subunit A [Candidatus Pelagibacterales bacterium]|nr:MAG: glutamyl-tRNA(Gln) amidotransferase subunit A [Pelagibacterales bacterium]